MVVADLNDEDYVVRSFFEEESIRLKISPMMVEENFENPNNKKIVHLIRKFQKAHGKLPTAQELVTGLNQNPGYSDEAKQQLLHVLQPIGFIDPNYRKKLIEDYFQFTISQRLMEEYALHMHDKDSAGLRSIMPKLKDALTFKLNMDMGLHYIRDTQAAMERLKNRSTFVPSSLAAVRLYTSQTAESRGTCGGYVRRGLSVVGATSGGGKSMFMVNEAAFAATMGYNVVYISLELDEEKIWERVTSCLLDIDRYQIMERNDDEIKVKLENTQTKDAEPGNLFIKWMPTRKTNMDDIEAYINELEGLENMKVDMVVIDYLALMSPIPGSIPNTARTDEKLQYVAEQIRNFCVIRNAAGLTGTQFNRSGYANKEVGLQNVAETMGLGNTADLFYAIINDPQMKAYGAVMNTILKNRNGPADVMFFTAVNWAHMKISDVTDEQFQELSKMNVETELNIADFTQTSQPTSSQNPTSNDDASNERGNNDVVEEPKREPKKKGGREKVREASIDGVSDML